MKQKTLVSKLSRPAKGRVSGALHGLLRFVLPVLTLGLVLLDLEVVAFALAVLSKWRVLAVKSRYWGVNLRGNVVDTVVVLSLIAFMSSASMPWTLVWFGGHLLWVGYLKKKTTAYGMGAQGIIAQALGVSAVLQADRSISIAALTVAVWFIAYFSARHIMSAYGDDHSGMISHVWALFALQLAWVLGHWQVWYGGLHQLVIILTTLLTSVTLIYDFYKQERLNKSLLRQIVLSTLTILVAVIVLADWQDKTI